MFGNLSSALIIILVGSLFSFNNRTIVFMAYIIFYVIFFNCDSLPQDIS